MIHNLPRHTSLAIEAAAVLETMQMLQSEQRQ